MVGLLENGDYAVLLFNRGKVEREFEDFWKDIGLEEGVSIKVRDLWKKEDFGTFTNSYKSLVSSNASILLKDTPLK